MLLTKEVEISMNGIGTYAKYYESIGYVLPKKYYNGKYHLDKKSKITVKVEDLPQGSQVIVQYKCDKCGEIFDINYKNYLNKTRNEKGEEFCIHCAPSQFNSREKHYLWRNDLTDEDRKNSKNRNESPEYNKFIRTVIKRDDCKCFYCGKTKNNHMVVHHLYSYANYPELRTDINNGVCLCEDCHRLFHFIYGRGNNTKEQFEEWCNKKVDFKSTKIEELTAVYCLEDNEIIYNITKYCKAHEKCYRASIKKACDGKQAKVNGKHYLYYNAYLELRDKKELEKYIEELDCKFSRNYSQYEKMKKHPNSAKLCKQIVCVENKLIFFTESEASRYAGVVVSTMNAHLKGRNKTCANLHWCYADDYNGDVSELEKAGDGW